MSRTCYGERMLSNDGLLPIGTGGNDVDRHTDQGLQPLEVAAGVRGQFLVPGDADAALLPTGQILVHGLGRCRMLGEQRRREHDGSVDPVAHANADDVEAVEHIEFGDAQRGAAVVHDRAPQRDRIEPAAAALPPGDRAEFTADPREVLAEFVEQFGRETAPPRRAWRKP